jgi:uncharacterized membrane protein YfcA
VPIELSILLTAFLVGGLVGITGVGGGAVMTPVLIIFFGIPPVVAIATDLVFATITKVVASIIHSKSGSIDWSVAKKIWAGSVPGTVVGIGLLIYLADQFVFAINILLCFLLAITAVSMLVSIGINKTPSNRLPVIGGGFIGFAVATTSVGAGAMGMALLRSLIGDRDPKKLVGTDIAHAIPVALIAGVSYFFAGFFDGGLLVNLLIGSLPGVAIGSLLVTNINASYLRKVLAVVLLLAAIGMGLNAFGVI